MRLLLLLFVLFPPLLVAQVGDTTVLKTTDLGRLKKNNVTTVQDSIDLQASIDTSLGLNPKKPRFIKKFFADYPNPKKALIAGLVFPAGGQLYNGAFWKAPIVYGAYGTVITLIATNRRQHEFFADQFSIWVNLEEGQNPVDFLDPFIVANYSQPNQVRQIRDDFLQSKEYSWIALFGVTLLSVADAFVECHLKDFDISDDLTFQWKPALISTPGWGNVAGVGVSIPLR